MHAWRELAVPHQDVLEGTFKQSEFAADLTQVVHGKATDEYQNPQKFYRRTFITGGMRQLLRSVAQRLSGKGGDPVVQLQTAFGGGKTHAMLAVYHLAKSNCHPNELQGVSEVLKEIGINDMPTATVAVIDGNNIAPNESKKYDKVTINTLWGELAWQLCGGAGYETVALSDQSGTSPGKDILIDLLRQAAPCVVLIDELVAYIRQFEEGKSYRGGTFASNMSFIQALTEACKAVPNAVLLASLPESEMEAAGARGREALAALEKFFGRVEAVWKPVDSEESFAIVKRRLFKNLQDKNDEIKTRCEEIHSYYRKRNYKDKFPKEVADNAYLERLINCYPIHPEVFDRLYEDWSTLENFQRTRGVLQFLAVVIYRLWNRGDEEPVIMPGSIPLDDTDVNTQVTRYLPTNWQAIIEGEIDGAKSKAQAIDNYETRFGKLRAARKITRTIFLGSAPASKGNSLPLDHVLLGACKPGDQVAGYEDALKRLADKLHYLSEDKQGYRFDTKPNLRREIESRKKRFNDEEHIRPAIKSKLRDLLKGASMFNGVHIFCDTDDVPDDLKLRLVIPEYDANLSYTRSADNGKLEEKANEFLQKRGTQSRQYRNRLLFLVVNRAAITKLKENASTYLAWQSVVTDIQSKSINLDMYQSDQAQREHSKAEKVFQQCVREAWQWLMTPLQEHTTDSVKELEWDYAKIDTSATHLLAEIVKQAKEEEWVVDSWSAPNLQQNLQRYYFKNANKEVEIKKIYDDMARSIYLQRLQDEGVLHQAIKQGVMTSEFGYANDKQEDHYDGLVIGKPPITVRPDGLLVQQDSARTQTDHAEQVREISNKHAMPASPTSTKQKKLFHAAVSLQPQKAKMEFSKITDEVLMHIVEDSLCHVEITVDITAHHRDGFKSDMQQVLRENCRALDFKNVDFEEEG
ncbi:MAG: hypothetical protein OYH77_06680 [Pseudomonadota bacterium]|nr:hypothetical protein [Pseudomonadota bacterium]